MAKKYTSIMKGNKVSISNNKLKDYFQNHCTACSLALIEPPEVNEVIPTEKELEKAVRTFKNNKSSENRRIKV